jgi:hypothetical protein
VSGDQALLDDDSDGPEDKDTFYDTNATMPMTVDSNEITDMTDMTDKTDKTDRRDNINDPVYHSAKRLGELLLLTVSSVCLLKVHLAHACHQSAPHVGNLIDHDGLNRTFYGSRIKKMQKLSISQSAYHLT